MKNFLSALKSLGLSLILLTIALVLFRILFIPAIVVSLVSVFYKKKLYQGVNRIARITYVAALSIDQFANVAFQEFWNITLIKKQGYKFGNPDETISGVLGKNKKRNTLSKIGKTLDFILDKLDPNHSIKSIEQDENNDKYETF